MGKRVVLLVMDGVGIGALPDAGEYGDEGSNTLGNLSKVCRLHLPCLESLGLGNTGDYDHIRKTDTPRGSYGKMLELSKGKDTVTGHWEMMGIINESPFPTYPQGFPPELILPFEQKIGRKVLGNKAASGTAIIEELGEDHLRTGSPIVYTSADSVFQIAAHEDVISREELYRICEEARMLLISPHHVCRVIARPFSGTPGNFMRTPGRRDYTLPPPHKTVLDHLAGEDIAVVAAGKVAEIFSNRGFSVRYPAPDNREAMLVIRRILGTLSQGILFCNLSDFDTRFGHRNDSAGFALALEDFDRDLSSLMQNLGDEDCLIITADHGCDPTTPSTDHSREYVPVLLCHAKTPPQDLGIRHGFCDIGATLIQFFGIQAPVRGTSLLSRQ